MRSLPRVMARIPPSNSMECSTAKSMFPFRILTILTVGLSPVRADRLDVAIPATAVSNSLRVGCPGRMGVLISDLRIFFLPCQANRMLGSNPHLARRGLASVSLIERPQPCPRSLRGHSGLSPPKARASPGVALLHHSHDSGSAIFILVGVVPQRYDAQLSPVSPSTSYSTYPSTNLGSLAGNPLVPL